MKKLTTLLLFLVVFCFVDRTVAQNQKDIFQKLQDSAIVQRKMMVPMRDGTELSTNIYRPKTDKKVPIIFSRTPYNFNRWVRGNGKGNSDVGFKSAVRQTGTARRAYDAIKHGYAYVVQNERGRYFSQGDWDILGVPLTDASDMFKWMRNQSWSNGKIGLRGCSSSAEWQLAAASLDNAADAMVPMGYGAGIGRVGQFYEQGNWFRGGVFQMLFAEWLYGVEQDVFRPRIPKDATREDLKRISRFYNLKPMRPPVDWEKAFAHLPLQDLLKNIHGKKQIFDKMIRRKPNDQAWYQGGLYHDNMDFNVPSFWFASWYDVSVSPNLALFNHVHKDAKNPQVRNNQYLVIAPTLHCGYTRATENTVVGERSVGDARLNYEEQIYDWFDLWLKGKNNDFKKKTPRVQYYTMGSNKWQSAEQWPPKDTKMVTFYLDSQGEANSLYGDGELTVDKPGESNHPDGFTYDPMNPVPTYGGGFCCMGDAAEPGALDQREMEARNDILVYTTKPLKKGVEVTGPIKTTLYVSSDVKDTDFTVRLIDVYPDGTAYNLRSTIQRARYRDGYGKEVFMKKGQVYKLDISPMTTSNYFKKGHRIRIEISSSNFPRFARNLNTGGNNYDETKWKVAHNKVHHSGKYPSQIRLSVKMGTLPVETQ